MTIENNAIITDAEDLDNNHSNTYENESDVADAFLKRWNKKDAETPSESSEEDETSEETELASDDGSDGNDHEAPEHDDESDDHADEDDARTYKVKVKGEWKEPSLRELKANYGRKEAIAEKELSLANERKAVEADREKYALATKTQLDRAIERYKPYEGIDWLVAAQEMDPQTLRAVRDEAATAYKEVEFYKNDLTNLYNEAKANQERQRVETAKQTIKTLEADIPDFRAQYPKMRTYAVENGMPGEMFDSILEPTAFRILHKAMLYDRGKAAQTKPVAKTPTKVIKGNRNSEATRKARNPDNQKTAMIRLKETGSVDAAADAFLARFNKR